MTPRRDLRITKPYLKGADVQRFQESLNYLAGHRDLPPIEADGEFGPQTLELARDVAWLIGLHRHHIRGRVSIYTQARILEPGARTSRELKTADKRWAAWKKKATLGERAYRVAASLVGVMEEGGNNVGRVVTRIIRENGGSGPESWCGDFVAFCYRHAGSKRVTRSWCAVRLLRGLVGVHATSRPRRGDLVRYTFDHVGIFVRWIDAHTIETIEGNTGSSGAVSDSATGGDGVYRKHRDVSLVRDYLRVVG